MQSINVISRGITLGQQRDTRSAFRKAFGSPQPSRLSCRQSPGQRQCRPVAALGGGKDEDKKFITREEEPDQFWQTKTEKKGQNPAQDPLALIGIAGLLLPFIILGIAIATGVVDVSKGKL